MQQFIRNFSLLSLLVLLVFNLQAQESNNASSTVSKEQKELLKVQKRIVKNKDVLFKQVEGRVKAISKRDKLMVEAKDAAEANEKHAASFSNNYQNKKAAQQASKSAKKATSKAKALAKAEQGLVKIDKKIGNLKKKIEEDEKIMADLRATFPHLN